MASVQIRTHCLLLVPPGQDGVSAWTEQARHRGWSVREVHDPCLALADVCMRDRMLRQRESDGHAAMERQVFLVTAAALHPRGAALLDAVRRYAPRTPVWTTDGGAIVPLTPEPSTESEVSSTADHSASPSGADPEPSLAPPSQAGPFPTGPGAPSLRLTGESAMPPPADVDEVLSDDDDEIDEQTTITPEEYDMLFRRNEESDSP